ncbi:Glutathione S-transferase Epsilon 12 [Hyalella azteca]|uniref:Glutathione S-transferase Epsilon 12 n=1 Tax=Hyalella azteca TaxID=294128 RepID=A0A6A0GWA6_HYAAZ|nr:Glutathione S-transferase Epsilon 12 [Hyalella azteca]
MDFYFHPASAPCRACQLTAKALGVKFNPKEVDLMKGEQNNPEFLAINPMHCVPTLVDGDFTLWESLYPKDPKTRALVDRLMYFDMGTLTKRFGDYAYPTLLEGAPVKPEKLEALMEALEWLDKDLAGRDYVAGSAPTIADFVLVASVATIVACGVDISGVTNVAAWYGRCKSSMAGFDENEDGAKGLGDYFKTKL